MDLLVFRSDWGMTGSLEEKLAQISEDGYDGVEAWYNPDLAAPDVLHRLLDQFRLKLTMAVTIETAELLAPKLAAVAAYEPLRIGIHGGRDSMTRVEGGEYFRTAVAVQERLGIASAFETHRGKLLYCPWDTLYYLTEFPEVRVVADFSHWVTVCERLPDDQRAALERASERAIHIHGRVGHEESPQVPDPAAPEYAGHLEWYESQWRAIWDAHHKRGEAFVTFTPEYGPPPYLQTLPYTRAPVIDQAALCLWAARRARQQFADRYGSG